MASATATATTATTTSSRSSSTTSSRSSTTSSRCSSTTSSRPSSTTTSRSSTLPARPRVNGSGSNIPLPPPSLQSARHTPAGPSTAAVRHNSELRLSSRLPVPSVAPVRAPNSTAVPAPPPRNGKVSKPVKPATARVAASLGKQTKPTSSVRALPRVSEPTATPASSAKPVVTKATASQSTVVPQPPKKPCAPVAPRTTKPVLAPASSTLPHPPQVQKRSAQVQTRLPLPRGKLSPVEDDGMEQVMVGHARALVNTRLQQCINHPEPYFGRDPYLHAATIVKEGEVRRVQCGKGRNPREKGYFDEAHVRKPFPMSENMRERFFMPCSSSRKIENRSSAAPKAKTVRFAGLETHTYRCMPARLHTPRHYREYGESTLTWEPSAEELESFKSFSANMVAKADDADDLSETF